MYDVASVCLCLDFTKKAHLRSRNCTRVVLWSEKLPMQKTATVTARWRFAQTQPIRFVAGSKQATIHKAKADNHVMSPKGRLQPIATFLNLLTRNWLPWQRATFATATTPVSGDWRREHRGLPRTGDGRWAWRPTRNEAAVSGVRPASDFYRQRYRCPCRSPVRNKPRLFPVCKDCDCCCCCCCCWNCCCCRNTLDGFVRTPGGTRGGSRFGGCWAEGVCWKDTRIIAI